MSDAERDEQADNEHQVTPLELALGESIIAIGFGAGFDLDTAVLVGAALGVVVVSALWWLYFDVAAILARNRLIQASGIEQAKVNIIARVESVQTR